ncbi:transmembrane protein 171 isoform X2 [Strigops habroptila]|uniref:transmembrane protein 171 isoform X2 n=1 Tax=Strigops habroptila TaxID=2489341 RepID=UPI0011D00161|nr:transmembrane protein 171 isoform X2 [Strigops habroptila]
MDNMGNLFFSFLFVELCCYALDSCFQSLFYSHAHLERSVTVTRSLRLLGLCWLGMLISILGIWVPGCSPSWHTIQLNHTGSSDVDLQGCGFLSLQIMGPLIVLTGLCFFVIAHVKKKQNLNLSQESCESEEQPQRPEPFQVTVGDAVMIFPPPPPPYFADPVSPTVTHCLMSGGLPTSENPPPYHSIFSDGAQLADDERTVAVRDYETIYTISGSSSPSDILPVLYLSSESPPKYEEKASITNNEYSLSSSSISLATSDTSS